MVFTKKDSIIRLQNEIIGEYQKTQMFLNKVFIDAVRNYKDNEIRDFAWECNDCLVDNPKLQRLLKKLNDGDIES